MRNASKTTTTTAASDTRVLKREPESGRKAPLNHIVFTLKEEHYTTGKVIQPVVKKHILSYMENIPYKHIVYLILCPRRVEATFCVLSSIHIHLFAIARANMFICGQICVCAGECLKVYHKEHNCLCICL